MGNMDSRARAVAIPASAFVMPITRPTTAPAARPEERCWQIGVFHAYWEKTGRELWKNSKRLNGAEFFPLLCVLQFLPISAWNYRLAKPRLRSSGDCFGRRDVVPVLTQCRTRSPHYCASLRARPSGSSAVKSSESGSEV